MLIHVWHSLTYDAGATLRLGPATRPPLKRFGRSAAILVDERFTTAVGAICVNRRGVRGRLG